MKQNRKDTVGPIEQSLGTVSEIKFELSNDTRILADFLFIGCCTRSTAIESIHRLLHQNDPPGLHQELSLAVTGQTLDVAADVVLLGGADQGL